MEIIDNKYKIGSKVLGSGGYGKVYLGTNIEINKRVAIKAIDLRPIDDITKEKLGIETDFIYKYKLDHPNIVSYYDFYNTPTYWYIVMEYCNAGTFSNIIEYNESMKNLPDFNRERNTHYYLTQLKDALEYIKNAGFMHRDIKPMNILLTKNLYTTIDVDSTKNLSLSQQTNHASSWPDILSTYPENNFGMFNICCDISDIQYCILDDAQYVNKHDVNDTDSDTENPAVIKTDNVDNVNNVDNVDNKIDELPEQTSWHYDEKLIVKLADFGLAKNFANCDVDMTKTYCGSPLYMAPELITRKEYNSQADLWSFGIVMYQLLFGVHPNNASKFEDLLHNLKTKEIDFHIRNNYSKPCIDLLKKLLTKNPQKRIGWDDFFNHIWFNNWNDNTTYKSNTNCQYQSKSSVLPIGRTASIPITSAKKSDLRKSSQPKKISNNFPNTNGSPNSPLGYSNLSRMKIDRFSFSPKKYTLGTYSDYSTAYPLSGANNDADSRANCGADCRANCGANCGSNSNIVVGASRPLDSTASISSLLRSTRARAELPVPKSELPVPKSELPVPKSELPVPKSKIDPQLPKPALPLNIVKNFADESISSLLKNTKSRFELPNQTPNIGFNISKHVTNNSTLSIAQPDKNITNMKPFKLDISYNPK